MASVLAVCRVFELTPDSGTNGVTAIDKRPISGEIKIGPYGVYGDVQANRKHHGGLDKAVYAYSQDDADFWSAELDREIVPGLFGENLRIEGYDVNDARIGERWNIGERLVLEVTMPRQPCQTFARRMGGASARGWVKRFAAERRLGTYLKVVRSGAISVGDELDILPAPEGSPTVREIFRMS
ncbi:MOSC domain-containing protein YiiM [Microbacterium halimionae]|uniref:MOSC domain-containing protein YiiM n=1 Tax=Microbacterium halimionae TaxID=1526413 RepID=A0A7W3JN05_9MICO|nr:MOSC domain-containing protein [Microbacterium halimionae]MBA8815842.1 MOSC domain-containing protein YiiM [Microbacterium halimionae]NII95888.1 MOSC domain-containing protein YiiM [Microbacterium halimionae]